MADLDLTNSLVDAARALGLEYRVGITASADTFYPGQERYDTFKGYVIRKFQNSMKEWQALNVLNYEMESATLLTIIATFGLKAACVASTIVNRTLTETPDDSVLHEAESNLAIVMKKALEIRFA